VALEPSFCNHGARGRHGGKADVLLDLDGQKLGLWPGLSVSAHLKQNFGRDANTQGDGSIPPVNTALGFPTLGGTTTDLSLIVSQNFANVVTTTGYHSLRGPCSTASGFDFD
jgi:hypothetical protein